MKRSFFLILLSAMPLNAGCILRRVINNSSTSEIILRGVLPVKGTHFARGENLGGVIIRPKRSKKPRVVTGNWSMGEYFRIVINEKTPHGLVCKKYRLKVDEKNQEVIIGKKEGCGKGVGEYDESLSPESMPEPCYVDIRVQDGPNSLMIDVSDGREARAGFVEEE